MTPAEIDALHAQAEAEFNANEPAMLIAPLAVIGLIEQLRRCERVRAETESYDQLSDG